MYKIYGIANCDTIKKTLAWFKDNQVAYEFHDYKKKGISQEKIAEWLTQYPWEKLINKAGTTWKKLSDEQKATDMESAMKLMLEKNSVIKRPIIEKESIIRIGFDINTFFSLIV